MKKCLIIMPIALALSIVMFKPYKASASVPEQYGYSITYSPDESHPYALWIYYYTFVRWQNQTLHNSNADNVFYNCKVMATVSFDTFDDCLYYVTDYVEGHPLSGVDVYMSEGVGFYSYESTQYFYVYNMPYRWTPSNVPVHTPTDPPPVPEAGESWLSDMWDWVLFVLGFGDDPSIIEITGGDKVETEIVTPTPSPSPTPIPTPTPYSLNVIDPSTGQPIYTITGIPGNTYNIYGGDTINNGSDFDIFDVDLKIGNGGASKPKDDLNEVMRTNNDYIQEMDVSAVKDSFSVLPADWFLMLGVLASMPIIAGIISKMLK